MKTLSIFEKYAYLLGEQDTEVLDATDNTEAADTTEDQSAIGDTAGESFLINLAVAAFKHTPTLQELEMIDEVFKKYGTTSPNKVASTLRSIISLSSKGNQEINNLLKNIR